jgi:hypothetical protein
VLELHVGNDSVLSVLVVVCEQFADSGRRGIGSAMSTAGGSRPCSPGWTRCCPAAIVDDPALVLLSTWIALAAEDPAELNRWLAVAEQLGWTGPLPDGTPSLEVGIASLPRPSYLPQARGRFPQGSSRSRPQTRPDPLIGSPRQSSHRGDAPSPSSAQASQWDRHKMNNHRGHSWIRGQTQPCWLLGSRRPRPGLNRRRPVTQQAGHEGPHR